MALTKTTLASATYIVLPNGSVSFAPASVEAVVYNNNLVVSPKVAYPGVFALGQADEGQVSQPEI